MIAVLSLDSNAKEGAAAKIPMVKVKLVEDVTEESLAGYINFLSQNMPRGTCA